MKKRTISAIILLILMIGSMIIDSKLFGILMLIFSVLGFLEFFNIRYSEKNKKLDLIRIVGILCLLLVSMNNTFYKLDMNIIVLIPLLFLSLPIVFYNDNKLYNISDALYNLGIVYFLGFAFSNIIYMGDVSLIKCVFIFIIAFITDIYAYIGGCLIGRHKLTSISPKKTIEGSIIGTIMGTLIGSVYYFNLVGGVSMFETVILCLFLTILSEFGDLFFSSIKRYYNKKDYSNLIPGHGGILDRFDSVIYVSLGLSLKLNMM